MIMKAMFKIKKRKIKKKMAQKTEKENDISKH